jgi:phosphatidylglycerophosphate synthase
MQRSSPRNERVPLALIADGLTVSRFLLGASLVPVLGGMRVGLGASLVGTAWITDFLDGRAARASSVPSRLGAFDLWADTLVGAGAVLGFVTWGWVPASIGLSLVVVLLASFALTRIEALSMILQAVGYALVLWRVWRDGPAVALAWLLSIVAVIGFVNRRILWERSLPTFFGGLAEIVRRSSR